MKNYLVASTDRSGNSIAISNPDSLRAELAGWLQDRIVQAESQFRSGLAGAPWHSHVTAESASTRGTNSATSGGGSRSDGRTRKVEGWREQQQALHRIFDFWKRAVHLYGSYKLCQLRVRVSRLNEEQRRAAWEEQHERGAEILHSLCTEMQGFFLKAGQFLAKPDMSPPAWVRRLAPLHDSAPADPFPLVRRTVEAELARADVASAADVARVRLEDVFAEFEEEPVGSASIAQVHRGRLKDGRRVAIKVQRAGAERLMLMDLANLRLFGAFLQRAELKVDLLGPISELEQQIWYEFDFEHEAAAMERIRHALAQRDGGETAGGRWERHGGMRSSRRTGRHGVGRGGISRANRVERVERVETLGRVEHAGKKARPEDRQGAHVIVQGGAEGGGRSAEMDTRASPVIVPAAIPGLVTRGLLVMDFIDGTPILRLPEEMRKRGISPSGALARQTKSRIFSALSTAYGCMLLQHGHFQADPHPGNILVCAVGRVALLDYGQTKQLHEALWLNLARSSPPSHRHNLNLLPFPLPPRCSRIFSALSTAYGRMLLQHGHFHADPHPGNILVCAGGRVALLDYGQTKQLPEALRLNLARLVVAIADEDMLAVGSCFTAMGIETAKTAGEHPNSFRRMAMIMFDTGSGNGVTSANPFGAESSLKSNAMKAFPADIFFIVRTMMLLKGLATGMGLSFPSMTAFLPIPRHSAHPHQILMVDFDFFDAQPSDYHGVKALLRTFLDGKRWDLPAFVDAVTSGTPGGGAAGEGDAAGSGGGGGGSGSGSGSVATVVKAGDEGSILGLSACLPLICKSKGWTADFVRFLHEGCDNRAQWDELWKVMQRGRVGVVVCERVANLPFQLVPHLFRSTLQPMLEKGAPVEKFLILTRMYRQTGGKVMASADVTICRHPMPHGRVQAARKQAKGAGSSASELFFPKPEDELLKKLATSSYSFPVHADVMASRQLKGFQHLRLVMLLSAAQVRNFLEQPFPLNDLPDDVLARVLHYVTRRSFDHALVCKRCRCFHHLPPSIGDLPALEHLEINAFDLLMLPETLGRVGTLRVLKLESERLTCLPDSLGGLSNLEELHLSQCATLTALPDSLAELSRLSRLRLSDCSALQLLPAGTAQLTALVTLEVVRCERLASLPEDIGCLVRLESMELKQLPSLVGLPESIGHLRGLRVLEAEGCDALREVPESWAHLSGLERLCVNGARHLTTLPPFRVASSALGLGGGNAGGLRAGGSGGFGWLERRERHRSLDELSLEDASTSAGAAADAHADAAHASAVSTLFGLTAPAAPNTITPSNTTRSPSYAASAAAAAAAAAAAPGPYSFHDPPLPLTNPPHLSATLSSLRFLEISDCASLISLPEDLGQLPALDTLLLLKLPSLERLPDSLGQLPALKVFGLSLCPRLEELPVSMANLPVLQCLVIHDCWRLASLPPNALKQWETLTELIVADCPALDDLGFGLEGAEGEREGGRKRRRWAGAGWRRVRGGGMEGAGRGEGSGMGRRRVGKAGIDDDDDEFEGDSSDEEDDESYVSDEEEEEESETDDGDEDEGNRSEDEEETWDDDSPVHFPFPTTTSTSTSTATASSLRPPHIASSSASPSAAASFRPARHLHHYERVLSRLSHLHYLEGWLSGSPPLLAYFENSFPHGLYSSLRLSAAPGPSPASFNLPPPSSSPSAACNPLLSGIPPPPPASASLVRPLAWVEAGSAQMVQLAQQQVAAALQQVEEEQRIKAEAVLSAALPVAAVPTTTATTAAGAATRTTNRVLGGALPRLHILVVDGCGLDYLPPGLLQLPEVKAIGFCGRHGVGFRDKQAPGREGFSHHACGSLDHFHMYVRHTRFCCRHCGAKSPDLFRGIKESPDLFRGIKVARLLVAAPFLLAFLLASLTSPVLIPVFLLAAVAVLFASLLASWVRSRDDGGNTLRQVTAAVQRGASTLRAAVTAAAAKAVLVATMLVALIHLSHQLSPQQEATGVHRSLLAFVSLLSFLLGGSCMALAAHAAVWVSVPAAARIAAAARRSPQEALQVAIRAAGAAALVVAAVPVVGLGINYSALLAFFHMHLAPLPASLAAQKRRGLSATAASAATAGSAMASAGLKPTDLPALLVCFCFGAAVVSLFYHLPPSIFSRSLALGHKLISRMDRSASEAAGGGANVVAVADMVGVGMARGAARACEAFCLAAAEAVASMVLGAHVAQHCAIDNPTGFILLPLVVLSLDLLTSAAAILSVSAAAGSSRLPHSLPVDSSSSYSSSSSPFSSHSPLFRSSPRSPMVRGSVLPTAAEEVVGCVFNGYALSLVLAVSSFALVTAEEVVGCVFNGYALSLVLAVSSFALATRWLLFTEQAPLAWLHFFFCALLGMLSSILLLLSSSLLSAPHLPPVRSLAIASSSGHASNISSGLALGIAAAAPPAVIVGLAVAAAVWLGRNSGLVDGKGEPAGGLLGLAVAVMGMLSSGCFSLTTDLFQLAVSHAGLLCKMMAQHQKQQQQGQMQQMQEFSLGPAAHDVMQDAHGMASHGMDAHGMAAHSMPSHGMDAYGMGMQDGGGMSSDHMAAAGGSPHLLQQQVSSDAAAATGGVGGGVATGEMAAGGFAAAGSTGDSSSSLQSSSLQSSALPPHAPSSSASASPAAAAAAAAAAAVVRTPVSPLEAAASAVASATRGMGCGASSLCSLLLVHAFVALVSSYSSTALHNIDLLRPELLVACMVGAAVVVGGVAMAGSGVTRCTAIVVREGRRHLHHRAEEKAYPRAPMVLDDPSRFVGAVAAVQWRLCSGCAVAAVQWRLCSGGCAVAAVQWRLCSGGCAAYPRAPMVLDDPSRFVAAVAAVSLRELLLPGLLAVAAPIAMVVPPQTQPCYHPTPSLLSFPPSPHRHHSAVSSRVTLVTFLILHFLLCLLAKRFLAALRAVSHQPFRISRVAACTCIIVRSVGKATLQPLLGARAVAALLLVAVLVTLLLAALFNGAGSAWRGARDVVEAGHLGGPGSEAHKATITGDTVGGTLRETLAPTLHILLNLLATAALAAAPLFFEH
ncbi:unnamed protein product [Closterium sp. NIES-64]|nr:unnamed protein product [Closterium sp. NIES-64]